jgi:hypothetical protein
MQLRAYNHWASMLGRRRFPTVADLASGAFCEIAPHSVLLDVSTGTDDPVIAYLGDRLEGESGAVQGTLRRLSDSPAGSLLARLAGHFGTVLVNRAPTGFEAEFAGLRGATVLYRGILLPFASDDGTIDFVLAVINWKERAGEEAPQPSAETGEPATAESRRAPAPVALLTDWADGPGSELGEAPAPLPAILSTAEPGQSEPALPNLEASLPSALAERLRLMPLRPSADLPATGPEFALVLIRRPANGPVALLGEVPYDPSLIEPAARQLAG